MTAGTRSGNGSITCGAHASGRFCLDRLVRGLTSQDQPSRAEVVVGLGRRGAAQVVVPRQESRLGAFAAASGPHQRTDLSAVRTIG